MFSSKCTTPACKKIGTKKRKDWFGPPVPSTILKPPKPQTSDMVHCASVEERVDLFVSCRQVQVRSVTCAVAEGQLVLEGCELERRTPEMYLMQPAKRAPRLIKTSAEGPVEYRESASYDSFQNDGQAARWSATAPRKLSSERTHRS